MEFNRDSVRNHIHTMLTSPIRNYAIAGLKSNLLEGGTVRLFTQETIQMSMITPHSHRYNLGCLVLKGSVTNTFWKQAPEGYEGPKFLMGVSHQEMIDIGEYEFTFQRQGHFCINSVVHNEGDYYFIDATDIHSIEFNSGTEVLCFQGPQRFDRTVILEPMDDDGPIPICATLSWMFKQ